jgi:hypothetical protein
MTESRGDLYSQILAHPGKRLLDALNAYGFSKNIFAGNAIQLRHLILALEDINDPLKVDGIEQRGRLQSLFSEVVRLFHNFLAGGKTLIDHTRNLIEEDFISEQHRAEYRDRIKRCFANDPLARFIQDFRNYVLHRGVPHIELSEAIEPAKKELNLQLLPMLEWQRWTPPARAFLENRKPTVRILELVDTYEAMVKSSHETFVFSFQTFYEKQIDGALILMNEWNRPFRK